MQSINKIKHKHLIDALHQLEQMLQEKQTDQEALEQAIEHKKQLEDMMQNYSKLIAQLEKQIKLYHKLYNHSKMKFLGPKLKELKKETPENSYIFHLLRENIRQAYGT